MYIFHRKFVKLHYVRHDPIHIILLKKKGKQKQHDKLQTNHMFLCQISVEISGILHIEYDKFKACMGKGGCF